MALNFYSASCSGCFHISVPTIIEAVPACSFPLCQCCLLGKNFVSSFVHFFRDMPMYKSGSKCKAKAPTFIKNQPQAYVTLKAHRKRKLSRHEPTLWANVELNHSSGCCHSHRSFVKLICTGQIPRP